MRNFFKNLKTLTLTRLGHKSDSILSRLCLVSLILMTFGVGQMWGDNAALNSSSSFSNPSGITFSISGVGSWKNAETSWSSRYKHCAGYQVNTGASAVVTWSGVASGKCIKITEVTLNATVESGGTFNTKQKMRIYTSVSGDVSTKQISSSGDISAQSISITEDGFLKDIGNGGSITMISNDQKWYISSLTITYTIENLPVFYGKAEAIADPNAGGTKLVSFDGTNYTDGSVTINVTGDKLSATSVTKKAYFKTEANDGYEFIGWYTNANGTGTKKSANSTYSEDLSISSTSSSSRSTITRYAHYGQLQYYYFKAQANKVGNGTVYASFTNGSFSATSDTKSERATTLAQTQSAANPTAYFKAVESDDSYHFAGWYTDAECTDANRESTDKEYSTSVGNSSQTSSASPLTKTLYAKFVQELTPEITATGFTYTNPTSMKVGDEISNAFSFLNTSELGTADLMVESSDENVITYANNKITAISEGTASITFTQAKTSTIKDGTFTFNFSVSRVENTLALVSKSYAMYVGQELSGIITGKNSNADVKTSTTDETLAYYDTANDKIVYCNTGNQSFTSKNVTIKIWQEANVKYAASGEKTITVTVKKYATSIAPEANYSKQVEQEQTIANYSPQYVTAEQPALGATNHEFYYSIEHSLPANAVVTGSAHPTEVIGYDPSAHKITAYNAGSAVLKIAQKQTYNYTGDTVTYNVTVTKNDNEFKYSWKGSANKTTGWSETMNLEEEAAFTYSTNNTITTPTITQTKGNTPGNVVATYSSTTNKITSTYNADEAIWTLHQDENYKYYGADATLTVTVEPEDCPTCYVAKAHIGENNVKASSVGEVTWAEVGVAQTLTYGIKVNGSNFLGAGSRAYLATKKSGDSDYGDNQLIQGSSTSSYDNKSLGLDAKTIGVKFSNVISDDAFIKDVRVSRKKWFKLTNTSGTEITELPDTIKNVIGGTPSTATFKVNYSTCDSKIKIVSNNEHILISTPKSTTPEQSKQLTLPSVSTRDGGSGDSLITIKYTGTQPEIIDAIITVYTKYENKTLRVHAKVEKKNQTINWGTAYQAATLTLQQGLEESNAATASSELQVTYRSGDENIIKISEDSTYFTVVGTGNTTLTAVQKGDNEFKSVTSTKPVIASNKKSQIITWNQNLTRAISPGQEIPLTAKVVVVDVVNHTQSVSNERTALIEYECLNGASDPIAEIFTDPEKGPCVRILDFGETTITASVKGNDDYEAAIPVTIPVRVPQPQDGKCTMDTLSWTTSSEFTSSGEIEYFAFNTGLPAIEKIFQINRCKGDPGSVSFHMRSVHYGLFQFWEGTFDVYESTDNGGSYCTETLKTFKPEKDKGMDVTVPLSRNATHIKIVRRADGVGYHFLSNMQIERAAYIETESNEINLGNIAVGESREEKITIDYSSIHGNMSVSKQYSDNGLTTEETIYADCGDKDSYDLPITVAPTAVGSWSNKITIMDEHDSKLSLVITLTANATQGTQYIEWNPTKTTFYTVEAAELEAQLTKKSNRNLDVTYSSSKTNVVSFSGSTPTINGNGEVTIYANCAATSDYKAAEQVSHVFTINRTPTQIVTAPTIDGTIYGGTSAASVVLNTADASAKETVKNDFVTGSYAITSPATLDAGTYDVTVTFTPSNTNLYAPSTITIQNVTVEQNTPTAEQAALYADYINYGQQLNEAVLHNNGTLAGTWTWIDEDANKEVRDAGTYSNLNVHFEPDNTNYAPINGTVSVTVDPIAPTGYSATATSIMAGQAASASEITNTGIDGTWAWASPSTTYPVADTYDVAATFTPSNTNYYAVETTLSLTVTPPTHIFTGIGDWDVEGNWTVMPSGSEPDVIVTGKLVVDQEITVGSLTIAPEGGVTIVDDGKLTIKGNTPNGESFGDLYVANAGEVDVQGSLRVGDLTVEASIGTSNGTAESGQVAQAENIVYANAYIEIHMDPTGTMDDTKWYGFTVPFAVDVRNGGVSRKVNEVYQNCTYGNEYDIAEYDATKRLNSGKGWKYLNGYMLNPGQFYYITVDGNYNTYRFKASDASYTPAAAASLAVNGSVDNANANWNGVGNSTLQHATASYTGGSYVQVYENGLDAYKTVATSEATFVVGCPFFIQATEASTLLLAVSGDVSEQYYAPRRASANQTGVARVNLTSADGGFSDQIYVSATDREQDRYLIGHDLSKAGESKIVPQLWINAYNQKLSVHEAAWQGNKACCALGLYAPQTAEYILTAKQPEDGTEVYLTYNGQVIWNLTSSEYVVTLEKGTTSAYGLQIVKAPAVTTGVDQIDNENQRMHKVLINDQVYIITPEGAMYDVLGKGIKF